MQQQNRWKARSCHYDYWPLRCRSRRSCRCWIPLPSPTWRSDHCRQPWPVAEPGTGHHLVQSRHAISIQSRLAGRRVEVKLFLVSHRLACCLWPAASSNSLTMLIFFHASFRGIVAGPLIRCRKSAARQPSPAKRSAQRRSSALSWPMTVIVTHLYPIRVQITQLYQRRFIKAGSSLSTPIGGEGGAEVPADLATGKPKPEYGGGSMASDLALLIIVSVKPAGRHDAGPECKELIRFSSNEITVRPSAVVAMAS